MQIEVKYFASMREYIGCPQQRVELTADEISIAQLWSQYLSDQPLPDNTLVAVNMEYCDRETLLRHGDEVAFFPPVTGG